jgi:hypothetical protein
MVVFTGVSLPNTMLITRYFWKERSICGKDNATLGDDRVEA